MRKENRITLIMATLVLLPVFTSVAAHIAGRIAANSTKPMTVQFVAGAMLAGMVLWFFFTLPLKAAYDVAMAWERCTTHQRIKRFFPIVGGMLFGLAAEFFMYFMMARSMFGRGRVSSTSGVAYFFGPFTFILPAMIAGYVFGFVVGWIARRYVADTPDDLRPSCLNCGYSLRGLEHNTCPECGTESAE